MKTTAKSIILKLLPLKAYACMKKTVIGTSCLTCCPTILLKAHILQTYILLNRNKTIKLINIANHKPHEDNNFKELKYETCGVNHCDKILDIHILGWTSISRCHF